MRGLEIKIKSSNLSLTKSSDGVMKPFGSVTLSFECFECDTKNEPLLTYQGEFETKKYNCTECGREYELGNNVTVIPEIELG